MTAKAFFLQKRKTKCSI